VQARSPSHHHMGFNGNSCVAPEAAGRMGGWLATWVDLQWYWTDHRSRAMPYARPTLRVLACDRTRRGRPFLVEL